MAANHLYNIICGDYVLELGQKTRIMGILNVTPDSFSDGGKYLDYNTALSHAEKMAEEGADIIDIGGESTRPSSESISEEEEMRRVIPLIENLAKHISIPISIDTTKSGVALKALDAGASIINDISSLRNDPELAAVAAEFNVPIILMHMKGTPKTMQESPVYSDLINEIKTFLKQAIRSAMKKGVDRSKIIIDPGIGFGKTFEHNFQLIKSIEDFQTLEVPILVGPSRKAFIRNKLRGVSKKELPPDSPAVETGTQAAVAAAALKGAHIVRCHNVANTCATLKIVDAIRNA
ncbi:MAG: dihydropteroate synthase [Deltaproteobacteria bacterium]|nr:dihydropteroate synthase [Deltaproteobacteria bacterium]